MPPPASPSLPSRSISLDDPPSSNASLSVDLALNGKALQERIAKLLTNSQPRLGSPNPESPTSETSGENIDMLEQTYALMQAKLQILEDELVHLRLTANRDQADPATISVEERETLSSRISELERRSQALEKTVSERDESIRILEQHSKQNALDNEKLRSESDARIKEFQTKLEDQDALMTQLKGLLEEKDGLETKNYAILQAKDAELALLEARSQKVYKELEEERKDLSMQIDELRKAGQVCYPQFCQDLLFNEI